MHFNDKKGSANRWVIERLRQQFSVALCLHLQGHFQGHSQWHLKIWQQQKKRDSVEELHFTANMRRYMQRDQTTY